MIDECKEYEYKVERNVISGMSEIDKVMKDLVERNTFNNWKFSCCSISRINKNYLDLFITFRKLK